MQVSAVRARVRLHGERGVRQLAAFGALLLRSPFSCGYLAVLLATSLYARLAPAAQVHRLVLASSTDAVNLVHRPLRCLLASALWLPSPVWPLYLVAFALAVAPLERRIGALRTLGVFALGHVGATLASEAPFVLAELTGGLAPGGAVRVDVGVSYGLLCCAGALPVLARHQRRAVALGVAAVLWVSLGPDTVAAAGHPVAYLLGVLLWPTVRAWDRKRDRTRAAG